MNEFKCQECGSLNEKEYIHCKNCGVLLDRPHEEPDNTGYAPQFSQQMPPFESNGNVNAFKNQQNEDNSQNNAENSQNPGYNQYGYNPNNSYNTNGGYNPGYSGYNPYGIDSIDGIPTDEVAAFVGKKAQPIITHFSKMELTHGKVSWCWPAAILGFVFGPIGASFWFFYRKMYKIALLLAAAGIVLTIATTAMSYGTNKAVMQDFWNVIENAQDDITQLVPELEKIGDSVTPLSIAASWLERLASIASCVLCGMYAYYFYRNHTVTKIREYRAMNANPNYYRLGLSAIGGVSGGMLALGIIILIFSENIASLVTVFGSL